MSAPRKGKPTAHFIYRDADGAPLYRNVRYPLFNADGSPLIDQEKGKQRKTFEQQRWSGTKWIAGRGCMDGVNKVPYRLPELMQATKQGDGTVYVTEGERKADLLARLGQTATSIQSGCRDYAKYFSGCHVAILEDNDDAGRSHAAKVAAEISKTDSSIKIIMLPGLAPGQDIEDWLGLRIGTMGRLANLVALAPEWQRPISSGAPAAAQRKPAKTIGGIREQRYVEATIAAVYNEVANHPPRGRNAALNRGAFRLGQLVGAGLLDRERAEEEMRRAAEWNGLWSEDGETQCNATIKGAISSGMRSPKGLPESDPKMQAMKKAPLPNGPDDYGTIRKRARA
jgi:hypothetical protein